MVPTTSVADPAPRFVGGWGELGPGPEQFDRPRGLDIDAGGIVYITDDRRHHVQKFDRTGNLLGGWGQMGSAPGDFKAPMGIAVDDRGAVYVVDRGNFRIQKFTVDGEFLRQWGAFGAAPGSFTSPAYIAADSSGNVFVTDGARVQKFTADGDFVRAWGSLGFGDGEFRNAFGIAVAPDQTVYVGNAGLDGADKTANIQRFTNDGVFLARWATFGEFAGQLMTPIGVDVDSQGDVYVVDHHNFRIEKFTRDGVFMCEWGERPGIFDAPHDLVVDRDDDLFIIDLTSSGGIILHFSYGTAAQATSWADVKGLFAPRGPATDKR